MAAALYHELIIPFGFSNKTFDQPSSVCQRNAPLEAKSTAHSLSILSLGGGAPRFLYTTMLKDFVRRGFVVVAIDHLYDALVVEFPDGYAT